jgi:multimeric flavodoxin WrbA
MDLLIVYHSQSGATQTLSEALKQGALRVEGVETVLMRAIDVQATDLASAKAIIICSPEYFGYMAGAIKDMFDRTYETIREDQVGKPYCLVIRAGNEGTGSLNSMERIIKGLGWRRVQAPIISNGELTKEHKDRCEELGQTMAAGIDLGIY